jgi:hypothetical protein
MIHLTATHLKTLVMYFHGNMHKTEFGIEDRQV